MLPSRYSSARLPGPPRRPRTSPTTIVHKEPSGRSGSHGRLPGLPAADGPQSPCLRTVRRTPASFYQVAGASRSTSGFRSSVSWIDTLASVSSPHRLRGIRESGRWPLLPVALRNPHFAPPKGRISPDGTSASWGLEGGKVQGGKREVEPDTPAPTLQKWVDFWDSHKLRRDDELMRQFKRNT